MSKPPADETKKNVVNEDIFWRVRCLKEAQTARDWDKTWGFLNNDKGTKKDAEGFSVHGPDPLELSGRVCGLPPDVVKHNSSQNIKDTLLEYNPRDKYSHPTLSSHEYGWRPPLESQALRSVPHIR
eukprot:TRINITY_DN7200_c0_g1::TRINITY_DN7200_c0_g1_i1::g.4695::m.4695 TRINITY_DN7200_c0_g1::TRINITY_DN7200_c0_g1_i1::g.4695  ORF type:complete len:136 (-),score=13.75,FAM183/PF14886.1/0.00061,LLC1/PF14945.1/0.0019 TRINITY_DN7200_c0_g1_i1:38-415(-)